MVEQVQEIKAEVGGVIRRGKLISQNDKTVIGCFKMGEREVNIKRHIVKHRVQFIRPGWETL